METLNLTISGMSCAHCISRVTSALATLDGVTVDAVQIGSADVRYDPNARTPADIAAAVTEAGYEARLAGSAG